MLLSKLNRTHRLFIVSICSGACIYLIVSTFWRREEIVASKTDRMSSSTSLLPSLLSSPSSSLSPPVFASKTSPSLLSLYSQPCTGHDEKKMKYRLLDIKMVCKNISEPCYIWHWDAANWTLTYTKENMKITSGPTRLCPIPIHGERTGKIIQADGKVEYPECDMKKSTCVSMSLFYAYFDKDLNERINRSPCCRKLLVDITHHMGRVFDKYNITYFLVGGPVISFVRDNGELIPYDTDTDVAVDANDVPKVEKAIPDLQKPGYIFKWKTEYSKGMKRYMVGCTNERCLTGPGIAFYSVEKGMVTAPVTGWPSFPANLTLPLIRGKFEGLEMGFPKKSEKYLDYVYGKDKWRTPYKCTKHYYGQCTA